MQVFGREKLTDYLRVVGLRSSPVNCDEVHHSGEVKCEVSPVRCFVLQCVPVVRGGEHWSYFRKM